MVNGSGALKTWYDSFPYDAIKAEMESVQAQVNELSAKLGDLQDALRLYERYRMNSLDASPSLPTANPPAPLLAPPQLATTERSRTLRESIRELLSEQGSKPEWSTPELRDELVRRGWLRPDKQGKYNLWAMLSVMAKGGDVVRVRTGIYSLPPTVTHKRSVMEP